MVTSTSRYLAGVDVADDVAVDVAGFSSFIFTTSLSMTMWMSSSFFVFLSSARAGGDARRAWEEEEAGGRRVS